MKKTARLCAMLIAVLGAQALSAQTDVTDTYLTNADFSSTDGWTAYVSSGYRDYGQGNIGTYTVRTDVGTAATVDATHLASEYCFGFEVRWGDNYASYYQETKTNLAAGVYTLTYDVQNTNANTTAGAYGNLFYVEVGGSTYYDSSTEWMNGGTNWTTHTITFTVTSESSAKISLGLSSGSTSIGHANTPVLYVSHLKLAYRSFTDVTEANPVDLTSMASNTKEAWTGATETPAYDGITMVAVYKESDWTGDALSQTINGLPAGNYRMEVYCQAHSAWDTDVAAEGATGYTYLCANEYKLDVPIRNADGVTTKELYTFDEISVTDGTLKISVVNEQLAANWLSVYVKSLTYFGPDKSLEEANFATNIAALNALSTNDLPTAFVTKINNLKSTYGSADAASMTLSELIAANGEIKPVVDLHPSMVSAYANLNTYISVYDNSEEIESGARDIFKAAIDKAVADANNAVTVEEINNVIPALEDARQIYVLKADPTNDTYFDLTFKVINPKFDDGTTTGWTSNTKSSSNKIATNQSGAITGNYYENWNVSSYTGEIYQELSGLPQGKYMLNAAAFRDQLITDAADGDAVYVFANDEETLVDAATPALYSVEVSAAAGTLRFGVKSKEAKYKWMGIDNVSLHYYGFDVAQAQTSVTTLKTEAEALVGKPMNAEVATALGEAIAGADDSKATRNELEPMIADLSTAIADAEASIAAYETIATYIAKANKIDESIAADYQTAYNNGTLESAETVFQELEVATYGYVKDEFSYPVELPEGNWVAEGPTGSKNEQHWSGEQRSYLEQSSSAWGQNAWSISYKQDKTLPAGDYVFKVSGRRAAGTGNTLSLVVTNINDPENPVELGVVNDFPEGDTGLGINKNGVTSFDAEDEAGFANNNNGHGWQWRYVKFTLTSETTVQVAVEAEATTNHQWISFCDATLQMTEDTYLDANMGALDAPTAAAEALVDTKPMGAAENTALKDALAMPVSTGAELLAKIEALETAVANANAWVAAYDEAKAPLVAALERFETDYNDAENGALDHMCKSRWATAVNMAQAAAVAKDVTDSYDGFATATENLVAALDAATVSVGEYAALKKAIDEANTLASANVGDQPFERPQSAADAMGIENAQTVYNAATADGEGVTSVTTSLNEAVTTFKAVPLNAPAEGVAYNIVLNNNNGWEYDGKAVTYMEGARNDAGLYNINYLTEPNVNYAQAFTFTAVEDQTDCYTLSMTDVDGNQRYVCTGVPYGGATGQLRTTTNDEDALVVKVIATTTDGVHNLFNTEANNYIGSQDGGFYTVNSHTNFNLVAAEKANVPLTISSAGWATLILPFNAVLPEGVKAYSCGEVAEDGETLTLVEAESIEANKPYLVSGAEGSYDFSGYGLAQQDSYTDGLFVGTYVNYTTTANSNTYVLQNGEEGVAFYRVGESAQPIVKAYRCYMTYEPEEGENAAPMFSLGRGEGTTSIDNAQLTNDKVVIYDLMGRKVTTMMKGGMYIVNGKKVVIR